MLFGQAKYPTWVPTSAYRDTGERSGFVRSVSEGGGGSESLEGTDFGELETSEISEAVPLEELTQSAADLASMQGVQVPAMPVSNSVERAKFDGMWMNFTNQDSPRSFVDFDALALEWNKSVSAMEEGKSPVVPIFRKTAASLKAHWKK